MPIYEFQCLKCNKKFEKILSISESNKKVKCDCSEKAVAKRVVSAPSFRLDGKGWYETDFKTGTKKNLVQSKDPKSLNKEQKNKPVKKEQPESKT
ncbi:MAG: FmdB family zinc ribbon protein [Gammaproteobacteria bacterium]|tara:strand:+ start:889 stop:1173 length:285 start_codon:yes stop_codon:yes gene_type:complete